MTFLIILEIDKKEMVILYFPSANLVHVPKDPNLLPTQYMDKDNTFPTEVFIQKFLFDCGNSGSNIIIKKISTFL